MANFYIGTSGWVYPHWSGVFYPSSLPQKDWLSFYSKNFSTVEVNATFYHEMKQRTFENWMMAAPKDFTFAIKGSRFITHILRLDKAGESVKRFFTSIEPLRGNKKNAVLFQLPPKWNVNIERLKNFLKILPEGWRIAFEMRDKSWFCEDVYNILRKQRRALVVNDSPEWPHGEIITSDFMYIRFHGATSLYSSKYSKKQLEEYVLKMLKWKERGLDVYAYFNNDFGGNAVFNAKELGELTYEH